MKSMNTTEMTVVNGGGYWGKYAYCSTCGKKIKIGWRLGTTFRRLFWSQDDFNTHYGSMHYYGTYSCD